VAALRVEELGLTPGQLAEVEGCDAQIVAAWLEAVEHATGLRSPAGWFMAGVRSGNLPAVVDDARRAQAIRLAELRVRNIGHVLPDEHELREELFGKRALLEPWASDELLVARMLQLWREQVAPGIQWPGH